MVVGEMEFKKTVAIGEDIVSFAAESHPNNRAGNFN